MEEGSHSNAASKLRRRLSLPLLALYGLGTTIGAGIFVLTGKVAAAAGYFAPLSFLLASLLAGITALAFAELAVRFPRSAGEALYVKEGFRREWLALAVGLLVATAGIVSAAAISKGIVGYLGQFIEISPFLAVTLLLVLLTGLAAAGIAESVTIAALFTLLEIAALLVTVWVGRAELLSSPVVWQALGEIDLSVIGGVLAGTILAFYAFIGFEDMVNVAEEVKDVERAMPTAILITLGVTAVIYVLVALTALAVVPLEELSASDAPVALVFETASGRHPGLVSAVAAVAVVNGALIQVIMASRVLYGLANFAWLPPLLARVNPRTGTPLLATFLVGAVIWALATSFPLVSLAQVTSFATLIIFALVNAALVRLKSRGGLAQSSFVLPLWVPALGAVVSALFAFGQLLRFLGL